MNEAKKWFKKSKEDLDTAKACFRIKKFEASAFYSQQAAEKALEALQIKDTGEFSKVHDLLLLANKVGAPKHICDCCAKLSSYYTITRYPDIEEPISGAVVKI